MKLICLSTMVCVLSVPVLLQLQDDSMPIKEYDVEIDYMAEKSDFGFVRTNPIISSDYIKENDDKIGSTSISASSSVSFSSADQQSSNDADEKPSTDTEDKIIDEEKEKTDDSTDSVSNDDSSSVSRNPSYPSVSADSSGTVPSSPIGSVVEEGEVSGSVQYIPINSLDDDPPVIPPPDPPPGNYNQQANAQQQGTTQGTGTAGCGD